MPLPIRGVSTRYSLKGVFWKSSRYKKNPSTIISTAVAWGVRSGRVL